MSSGLASLTSMSPAPPITVSHPAHRRAPAIQPVQRSMSRSASSGTGRSRQISATVIPRSLPDAIAALPDQPRTARRDDPAVRRCNPNYYTTTTDDSEASTFGASAMSGEFRFWSGARDLNPGPHGPEPCRRRVLSCPVVSARFLLCSSWIFFLSLCDLLYPLGSPNA